MAEPIAPRPTSSKAVSDVPITFVAASDLPSFESAVSTATAMALDTETVYNPEAFSGPNPSPGELRVISVATRNSDAFEQAWVIDVTKVDRSIIAEALNGTSADAWNADFDARVLDRDLFTQAKDTSSPTSSISWWDAQLADALLHQGRTGFSFYHGLAWAVEWYLCLEAEGKGTTQLSYTKSGELTDAQITYAAADAVETLWVADEIRSRISLNGLDTVCRLEQGARPFLDHMEREVLPFDWSGWESRLLQMEADRKQVSHRLAELTGGGQGNAATEARL